MRIGEITIVLTNISALAGMAWRLHSIGGVGAVVILAVLLHWFIEKGRWQMVPAYLVSFGIAIWSIAGVPSASRFNLLAGLLAAMLLLVSMVFGYMLPIFSLPRPSGRHAIGTVTRTWSRIHPSHGTGMTRTLTAQFWYPAQVAIGKRSPYRTEHGQGIKSYLRLVRTHSFVNAPIVLQPDKHPVVLFSPGWRGHLTQNSVQFEMLASHGFVVVSVVHPAAENLPPDFDASLQENLNEYPREARLRAEDMSFVIDQLEKVNDADPENLFTARLDTSRVGIFGYSFGGAVATETCWLDDRLKAGINMDGMLFGDAADAGVSQPFLFMSCDGPLPSEADLQCEDPRRRTHMRALDLDIRRIRRSLAQYGGYYLLIRGSSHSNFSDRPLYSPLRTLTDAGSINGKKAFAIINDYTLAFFRQYLLGVQQDLLEGRSQRCAEVEFERRLVSSRPAPQYA